MCVGYTTQIPIVLEAARALSWRADGVLRDMYDDEPITQVLRDCMDIIAGERQAAETYAMTPGKRA